MLHQNAQTEIHSVVNSLQFASIYNLRLMKQKKETAQLQRPWSFVSTEREFNCGKTRRSTAIKRMKPGEFLSDNIWTFVFKRKSSPPSTSLQTTQSICDRVCADLSDFSSLSRQRYSQLFSLALGQDHFHVNVPGLDVWIIPSTSPAMKQRRNYFNCFKTTEKKMTSKVKPLPAPTVDL